MEDAVPWGAWAPGWRNTTSDKSGGLSAQPLEDEDADTTAARTALSMSSQNLIADRVSFRNFCRMAKVKKRQRL